MSKRRDARYDRCASDEIDTMERSHLEKGNARPPPLRASKFPRRRAGEFRAHFSSRYLSPRKRSRHRGAFWRSATRTITVATRRLRGNNMIITVTWCGSTRELAAAGGHVAVGAASQSRATVRHPSKREGCGTDRSVSSSRPRVIRVRRSARLRHPVWWIFNGALNGRL